MLLIITSSIITSFPLVQHECCKIVLSIPKKSAQDFRPRSAIRPNAGGAGVLLTLLYQVEKLKLFSCSPKSKKSNISFLQCASVYKLNSSDFLVYCYSCCYIVNSGSYLKSSKISQAESTSCRFLPPFFLNF